MYRCWNCGVRFEEPNHMEYSYEDYFGVSSMFRDRHYFILHECPSCGSEEIEEYSDEADLGEDDDDIEE